MSKLELSIAWRYLRSRRGSKFMSLISLIAILGLTVAVSALIVIIGVMDGLQNDLREKILIGSPDIRVMMYGEDMVMDDWQPVLRKILRQKDVVAADPFVFTQAVVQSARHKYMEGAFVLGLLPDGPNVPQVTTIRDRAVAGDFTFRSSDGKRHGAVLGKKLAERLNATPGIDSVTLLTINPNETDPITGQPKATIMTFEVTGIFDTGMYEYDNSYVIIAIPEAQQLAHLGASVTGIEVKTPSRWDAPKIAQQLLDSLGSPMRVVDWHQQNNTLFTALKLEKLGMTVILLLIVLVAAFNIISTLTMVVTDKTKEIGILRAMGMPAKSIRRVFFAQGLVIGVVGTGAGTIIGASAALLIDHKRLISLDPSVYYIDHLPVSMQPLDLVFIVVASLAVAALATIYPSTAASRLVPVEAIRHE
ncbi:MAG TPA: FtsX-like permease family protein [Gemmatimonadaceae bacterium]|nr:FtsX-like permease family protein [Gemmatimonadaceae bacterium]